MIRSRPSSTVVICAGAPRQPAGRQANWVETARSLAVPVTWLAGVDDLAAIAGAADLDVAIDIPPAACGSRQRLRDLLARGRDLLPDINSVVLRGPTALEHRVLLAEHGVSVALVDAFSDEGRGCRRPAPRGWACRNVVWGLWEVLVTPPRPGGIAGWLGLGGSPRLNAGGLQVLRGEAATGGTAAAFVPPRLQRWIAWAEQRRARGGVDVVELSAVPRLIAGAGRQPMAGSVLRAA
jgi:hypothetical protein